MFLAKLAALNYVSGSLSTLLVRPMHMLGSANGKGRWEGHLPRPDPDGRVFIPLDLSVDLVLHGPSLQLFFTLLL